MECEISEIEKRKMKNFPVNFCLSLIEYIEFIW